MIKAIENYTQRLLARSSFATQLAVKIRNQSNCIIAYHLGESSHADKNGELKLLKITAPHVKTFIDVGANIGSWSEQMLENSSSTGFLFEPSNQCLKVLKERLGNRDVVIRDCAVSDQCGTAPFAEEDNCGETSSLIAGKPGLYRQVLVTTLDAEFTNPGFSCDFLKIDTEGFDLKVLKGARQLLSRTRFVQFEYNSFWIPVGSSLAEASQFLSDQGFSMFLIRSSGLHTLRYDYWNDYFRYSNYFACRNADLEIVRPILRDPI